MYKYLIATLLLLSTFMQSETLTGKVISVKDGDTIDILIEKTKYIIRLDGVDAPEKKQAFGQKSKQFASDFCFGKVVTVEVSSQDRYGRNLGKVYLDDKCLNEELLRVGLAWHYKQYNKEKELADFEQNARDNKLGLWVDKDPIPPWDFRKGVTKEQRPQEYDNAQYVGSVNSKKFHKPWCKYAKKIEVKNLIYFDSIKDAENKGYKPCKECNH